MVKTEEMVEAGSRMLTPPSLDLSNDMSSSWSDWLEKWDDYTVVTELRQKSAQYQCSMLRYTFSDETRKIYNSMKLTNDDKRDPDKIIQALERFVKGVINITLERYVVNCRKQDDGESFDDFLRDVKMLSSKCNFCANCRDSLMRDRIVIGVCNEDVRQTLLSHNNLTLNTAEDICREMEKTFKKAKTLQDEFKIDKEFLKPLSEGIDQNKKLGNGNSQNASEENRDFTEDEHVTASNETSNPAKSSVKVVRRMITKCRESKNNILKGLQILGSKPFHYGSIPTGLFTTKTVKEDNPASQQKNERPTVVKDTGHHEEKSKVKVNRNEAVETFKSKDQVVLQHYVTKEWSLRGSIETEVAPGTYTVKLNDGRTIRRNICDIRSIRLTNNVQENTRIVNEAVNKMFNGNCQVTPSDLIKDHVIGTQEEKYCDDPDTFIEYDMSSDEICESLPYDESSFNDRTTISSCSNSCNDELSDTIEYDMESDAVEYDMKAGEVNAKGQAYGGKEKSNGNEYIYTTYM